MKPRVLLLGEALVDRLPSGPVAAGAPLNVARHLQALGVQAQLVSRVGADDADARRVLDSLASAGLSPAGLQRDPEHATGAVDVVMQPGGSHRFDIAHNVAWDHLHAREALATLEAFRPHWVYYGTLAQRSEVSRRAIRAVLDATDAPCYLDLNLRDGVDGLDELVRESLHRADWLKVNDEELGRVLAWTDCRGVPELMQRHGLQVLVLTRGEQGYAAFDASGQCTVEGPGVGIERLADTVGAGDAFSACLLAARLQGKPLAHSLALANRFAAAICGEVGAAPAQPDTFYPPFLDALRALPETTP